MSIVVIEGPPDPRRPAPAPPAIVHAIHASMVQRAEAAGCPIRHHVCATEAELVACLRNAHTDGGEIVLLDPGACARAWQVLTTLRDLDIPYVEVHDDRSDAPEPTIQPRCGPLLAVINGYGAQSFTVALSVALDRLCCSEIERDYHVGT